MQHFVRIMGTGEIIGAAFQLLFRHFFKLTFLSLIVLAINLIVSFSILLVSILTPEIGRSFISFVTLFSVSIMLGVVITQLSAATLLATSNAILGRPVRIWRVLGQIFSINLFGRLLLASLVIAIIVMFGYVLLIIPGLVLIVLYSFTSHVLVLEKLDVPDAMTRSRKLVSGEFWHVVWIMFLSAILSLLLTLIPLLVAGFVINSGDPMVLIFAGLLYLIALLIVSPFYTLVLTLLYYDLRARKENYNEEVLAEELGYEPLAEMLTV